MTMTVLFSALGIPLAPGLHVRKADRAKVNLSEEDVRQIGAYDGDAVLTIEIDSGVWEVRNIRMAN